jgi:hypothetical protein
MKAKYQWLKTFHTNPNKYMLFNEFYTILEIHSEELKKQEKRK